MPKKADQGSYFPPDSLGEFFVSITNAVFHVIMQIIFYGFTGGITNILFLYPNMHVLGFKIAFD